MGTDDSRRRRRRGREVTLEGTKGAADGQGARIDIKVEAR